MGADAAVSGKDGAWLKNQFREKSPESSPRIVWQTPQKYLNAAMPPLGFRDRETQRASVNFSGGRRSAEHDSGLVGARESSNHVRTCSRTSFAAPRDFLFMDA